MIYPIIVLLHLFFFSEAQAVSSWNITVYSITSSSARVYWPNLPLPQSVSNYLVRYKEVSNGIGRLFEVNGFSNSYYTSRLKGYTAYDVQVFAVTSSGGNATYASNTVSILTAEGGKSKRRRIKYHYLCNLKYKTPLVD